MPALNPQLTEDMEGLKTLVQGLKHRVEAIEHHLGVIEHRVEVIENTMATKAAIEGLRGDISHMIWLQLATLAALFVAMAAKMLS